MAENWVEGSSIAIAIAIQGIDKALFDSKKSNPFSNC